MASLLEDEFHSILDVYAILDKVIDSDEDFLICSIDIRKAFDSVSWDFLRYVLGLFQFPPEFISWFNVFYADRTAYIVNNNERSNPISIHKGNFQGCPLSPLFFALAIEIFAIRIRNNEEISGVQLEEFNKKINLVADDILLIFKNDYAGCSQVEEELKEFSQNSGLKVNPGKCTISRINRQFSNPESDIFSQFQRKKDHIDYVGLNTSFSPDKLWNSNIPKIIDKMLAELSSCSHLNDATPLGKVNVIKSLFYSRLPYFLELVTLPNLHHQAALFDPLQCSFSDIIWNSRKPKMKKGNIYAPTSKGGFGMFDLHNRYKAIKIALLKCAVDTCYTQFWQAHLFQFFNTSLETVLKSNISFPALQNFLVKLLTPFWHEVFLFWCSFHLATCSSQYTKEELQEFLARPAYFNSAFTSKHLSNQKRVTRLLSSSWLVFGR